MSDDSTNSKKFKFRALTETEKFIGTIAGILVGIATIIGILWKIFTLVDQYNENTKKLVQLEVKVHTLDSLQQNRNYSKLSVVCQSLKSFMKPYTINGVTFYLDQDHKIYYYEDGLLNGIAKDLTTGNYYYSDTNGKIHWCE